MIAPFPAMPRRAGTCGQDARGPGPRLRRGCASPGGIVRVADVRAGRPRTQEARRSGRGRRCGALRGSAGFDSSDHWREGRNDCALPGNAAARGNVRAGCPRSRAPPSAGLRLFRRAARGSPTCGRGRPRTQEVRTSGVAGHCGDPRGSGVGETTAPFSATLRRAGTCGQDARGPGPRLRRGCASSGERRVGRRRAGGTPAHPRSAHEQTGAALRGIAGIRGARGGRDARSPGKGAAGGDARALGKRVCGGVSLLAWRGLPSRVGGVRFSGFFRRRRGAWGRCETLRCGGT